VPNATVLWDSCLYVSFTSSCHAIDVCVLRCLCCLLYIVLNVLSTFCLPVSPTHSHIHASLFSSCFSHLTPLFLPLHLSPCLYLNMAKMAKRRKISGSNHLSSHVSPPLRLSATASTAIVPPLVLPSTVHRYHHHLSAACRILPLTATIPPSLCLFLCHHIHSPAYTTYFQPLLLHFTIYHHSGYLLLSLMGSSGAILLLYLHST